MTAESAGRPGTAGWYDLRVRLADNDHYGHVNNARYYEYFDTAINGWLMDAAGIDLRALPALSVVVSSSCRFRRELQFPDRLKVAINVARLGHSSITYRPEIFRVESDESLTECASGEFVHVFVDPGTQRPTPIPDEVAQALSSLASLR